jgi:hypothetical protein
MNKRLYDRCHDEGEHFVEAEQAAEDADYLRKLQEDVKMEEAMMLYEHGQEFEV